MEVFNASNNGRVYECFLNNGENKILQVYYNVQDNIIEIYDFLDEESNYNYIDEVEKIVGEVTDDYVFVGEPSSYEDEHEPKYTPEELEFMQSLYLEQGLYKFNTKEEFLKLYNTFKQPIADNFNGSEDLFKNGVEYGLFYTWSHWDDFDDYPMHYCAVFVGRS